MKILTYSEKTLYRIITKEKSSENDSISLESLLLSNLGLSCLFSKADWTLMIANCEREDLCRLHDCALHGTKECRIFCFMSKQGTLSAAWEKALCHFLFSYWRDDEGAE